MKSGADLTLARSAVFAAVFLLVAFGVAVVVSRVVVRETHTVHLDPDRVAGVQRVLGAIVPAASVTAPETGACANVAPLTAELDARLEELHEDGFVTRPYKVDASVLLRDPGDCAEPARAVREVIALDILRRAQWRERMSAWAGDEATFVRVEQETIERALQVRNPWRSLPGCVLLARPKDDGYLAVAGMPEVCRHIAGDEEPDAAESDAALPAAYRERLYASPFMAIVGADFLAPWRNPDSALFQRLVGDTNTVPAGPFAGKNVGLHVLLTFDPKLQAMAQAVADCFTGNVDRCATVGVAPPAEGYHERARARLAAVAVIDVASGAVEAAASAESRCFAHDTQARGAPLEGCPQLGSERLSPVSRTNEPAAYRNHAITTAAPPASTIKPIMLAGFLAAGRDAMALRDDGVGTIVKDAFRKSLSAMFLSWMYCGDRARPGAFPDTCERPAAVQQAALALGWNAGCGEPGSSCGEVDVLFGRPPGAGTAVADTWGADAFRPVEKRVLLGRLLTARDEQGGATAFRLMSHRELSGDPQDLAACAAQSWEECRHAPRAVSDMWGDGNARATPLGIASAMATLAASANGAGAAPYPRIVSALLRSDGSRDPAGDKASQWGYADRPAGIPADAARRILAMMETTHAPGGTAHASCARAGATCPLPGLAGKTGTTAFPSAITTLESLARVCEREANAGTQAGLCKKRPWRWFAGAFKSDPASATWDKAFAVLVERNWTTTGEIGDRDEALGNGAVEMSVILVQQYRQALGSAQATP